MPRKDQQKHERLQREQLQAYKAIQGCERCDEDNPNALDLHHTNPAEKEIQIGQAFRRGWSAEQTRAELGKCVVLCANCHRKEHHKVAPTQGDIAEVLIRCADFKTWQELRRAA